MKNLFYLIVIVAFFGLNACEQKSKDAPANVKTAFSQKFPNVTNLKWEKEKDKDWEAEFKMDGKEYKANFDINGTWMETEYKISTNEIPEAVKMAIEKDYAGYKIEKSKISENAAGKVYKFKLKKDDEKIKITFDLDGTVIKKENEKEKD